MIIIKIKEIITNTILSKQNIRKKMKIFSIIKECDRFPVNILKGKFFKNLPGAIFSLFMSLLNFGAFFGCIIFYFLQRTQVTLKYKPSSISSDLFPLDQSTINIAISQLKTSDYKAIDYIANYYLMASIIIKDQLLQIKLYQTNLIEHSLNYSILYNTLFTEDSINDINFPRIGYYSCTLIKRLIIYDEISLIEPEDQILLDNCIDIDETFYDNVKDYYFAFKYQVVESYLTSDFSMKTQKSIAEFPFKISNNSHNVYKVSQKQIAVLFDHHLFKSNSNYEYFINWLFPVKTQIKAFSDDFSLQTIFSNKFHNQILTYHIYKLSFFSDILSWLGSISRTITCLEAFPALWYSYYLTVLVYKLYKKRFPNKAAVDLDNLSYCRWLVLKFGCTKKAKNINQEVNRMRKELSAHFEKLYRRRTCKGKENEVDFDTIYGIKIDNSPLVEEEDSIIKEE